MSDLAPLRFLRRLTRSWKARVPQRLKRLKPWLLRVLRRDCKDVGASTVPFPIKTGTDPFDTFCVMPWKMLEISPQGEPKVCCKFSGRLPANDGSPLSVYTHSLAEIWNSDAMRAIRRDMVEGKGIPGCKVCYQEEATGGTSLRTIANRDTLQDGSMLNEEHATIASLKARAVAKDFRLPPPPERLDLDVGNLCNLKCRMCNGFYSSRIDQDPVHSSWASGVSHDENYARISRGEHWFRQKDLVQDKLLRDAGQLRWISLMGGEPFLIKEVGEVLQHLIDEGVSERIVLEMTTNATVTNPRLLKLTERFRHLHLIISVDGIGKCFEYIRYPAKWNTVVNNIEVLKGLPNVSLASNVTLQIYNALNVVDIFRYLDSAGVELYVNILTGPDYLRASVMPPRARRLAAVRMRSYAGQDCRPAHREMVLAAADGLEAMGEKFEVKVVRDFMLFTNDLDASRKQSFRETHGELWEFLADAGFAWTEETLHAGRVPPEGRVELPTLAV